VCEDIYKYINKYIYIYIYINERIYTYKKNKDYYINKIQQLAS